MILRFNITSAAQPCRMRYNLRKWIKYIIPFCSLNNVEYPVNKNITFTFYRPQQIAGA